MGVSDQVFQAVQPQKHPTHIQTTLYDIIEAINQEIGREEEHLIAQTVSHLIKTAQMKFVRPLRDAEM